VNKADPRLLMGLLRRFAESEAKAGRLRDRILLARGKPPGAGENQEQQEGNADGDPAAKPSADVPAFVDVAQLRGFDGMTPELYAALAPYLTVYSGDGRINARAAPAQVLASIPGLSQGDVENLRASASAPKDKDRELSEAERRAGAYLSDKAGPAYLVTVEVLRKDGGPGASAVYVVAVGLDPRAPYRLIAIRPVGSGQLSKPG
jgi:general secretion pathway protein K